jgi:hypothetical protein
LARSETTEIALVPDRGWLTLKEASRLSRTPMATLKSMIRLGELHAFTIERGGKTKFRILRSALIDAGLLAIRPPDQNATFDVLALIRDQNARIAKLEDQRSQLAGQLGIALERLRSLDDRLAQIEQNDDSIDTNRDAPSSPTPVRDQEEQPAIISTNAISQRRPVQLVRKSLVLVAGKAAGKPWKRKHQ